MKSPSKLSPMPSVASNNRYQFCFFEWKIFMLSAWMIGRFHYLTDVLILDTLNPMIELEILLVECKFFVSDNFEELSTDL